MSIRKDIDTLLRKLEKEFVTHNLIEISRSALLHNLDTFTTLSGKQVLPVLKGNAYGHGIELVATALKERGFPYIAVDGYFEALRIREVSNQPILIMGAILPENFANLKYDNFAFVVQDEATVEALGKTGRRVKVHIECNTGFNRYGTQPDEVVKLVRLIQKYQNLELEGVMSHLADADGNDPSTVDIAVSTFDACVEAIRATGADPSLLHIAQSAGSLKAQSKYANAIRLGIGLYGINPFPKTHTLHARLQNELRPALRLTSTITHITELKKGDKVSYNYTFTAPRKMTVGVLPLGYYEGAWLLARGTDGPTGHVKIGQSFTPIVGRVCMNHTIISLDGIAAKVGDTVIVYSEQGSDKNAIDTIASTYGLFNYAMLTALSSDVRRVLVP
ncbi:MAG TPA: alanine racemase [Verrucomicrobiae bacterium]|nr:alanine racemase [Verrucomicrobiae bacterium]